MSATVRESDDGEPTKNEPLNSDSSKSAPLATEPLKRESLRSEPSRDGSLKRDSLKRESLNRQPSKIEPSKNQPYKDEPRNVDSGPSGRMTEAPEPLWKRKAQRGVFEGDVAVVELRSRLALAPERILEPAASNSTVSTFARLLRLTGGVLMAGAVAGVTGYLGFRLWTKSPQVAPASGQADVVPTVTTPAAIGVAPVDARGAAHEMTPADGGQQPLPLATAPRSGPPSPSPPPAQAEDASEIATKMKANEDIFRQFMLWRDQQQRKQ